ncbi:MAG: right-handed parallel beta-helix repeat-containing protein [Clostridiales bacterium]|nr:right-handed parallel beta-helix repeat-containing protein [Clostridiales bacterium]
MKKTNKLLSILTAAICISSLVGLGGAASTLAETAAETDSTQTTAVVKYIKNSYTAGAYMYEENGMLRYGIPLSADEAQYKWEFIDHDGVYEIKNVATGHSITSVGGGDKTPVKTITEFTSDDLWKIDISLPCDEFQIFNVATNADMALHIIDVTDGYVVSGQLGSSYEYGEALWGLFDASEISFEGVIRDGFCIGDNNGNYLTSATLTFRKPSGPNDDYIWRLELASDGSKLLYNVGKAQYLTASGGEFSFVGKEQAMHFDTFATSEVNISFGDGNVLTAQGSSLGVGSDKTAANAKLNIVLASAVGTVLGDLKLDGIYTLSNSWFNMYMLDDGGIPTYGNSAPNNTQIQWEVIYDEKTTLSALKNVGRNEYMDYNNGTLGFSKDVKYVWKVLRNSNDLYPEAIRFNYSGDGKTFLHMEHTDGQLECGSDVQATWGSPHWEAVKFDSGATATMSPTSVEAGKWFRIKSAYSDGLYFYQTNGGYAYGAVGEKDARSHWRFVADGSNYLLYNRNFELYVGSFGNGYLAKMADKADATKFGVSKYNADGSLLIFEQNAKDYLSEYVNIKGRDSLIHLSLVSVDIKETRWILEDAPAEIETNEIVVNNTVLSTFVEDGKYSLNGKSNLTVEHYGAYVRVSDGNGQYLYINGNKSAWKKFTHDYDTAFYFNYEVYGDDLTVTHGNKSLQLKQVATDRRFMFNTGFTVGNASTISVYAAEAKTYSVTLHTMKTGVKNEVYLDGLKVTEFTSGDFDKISLPLRKGNNLIKFTRADAVDSIVISDIISNGYQGATQGITAYEMETGKTNANVEVDSRTRFSMAAEASGRSYVILENVTEYAEITLVNAANAFVLRYSVPDTADGKGKNYSLSLYVNGKDRGNLTLTSEHTHLYKEWDYTNNPKDGYHHVYFDELTYKFDEVLPAGTVLRFRRDFDDEATYYALDLLETEIVPDKIEKPDNALSITDYMVEGRSDYDAFIACVNEASRQGKEVYIPEGVYNMGKRNSNFGATDKNASCLEYANNTLNVNRNGITIRGAGYWYTEIHGLQFELNANDLSVYSLKLMGYANTRNDTGERACFDGGDAHTGLTLANLWIVHYKVGAWLTDKSDTFISGNRIRYTYADGVNFQAGDKTGVINGVIENNSLRSNGDDGLAAWSSMNSDKNITYRYNTIQNPWHANCIALYGGTDVKIYNNILKDTAYRGAGVNISTDFEPTNFSGYVLVYNNLIDRCGGDSTANAKKVGGIWFNMIIGCDSFAQMQVKDNVILNSTYQGVSFEQGSIISSLVLEGNTISGSGSYGIEFSSDVNGNILLKNNAIINSALEEMLDNHKEDNATVVIVNDKVNINITGSGEIEKSGAFIALWVVSGVMLAGAIALSALLAVMLLKKHGRKE